MKALKIFLIILFIGLVIIQFFPIEENYSETIDPSKDFIAMYDVPAGVEETLKTSCYDCHSNNTTYLWYDKIQPVAWYIQDHVDEGKEELNFNEFGTYSAKKKHHKIEEVAELVKEGEMPLTSYTLLHTDAKLSEDQKTELVDWFSALAKEK